MVALWSELRRPTQCRALVGGYGVPGQRDLDFGRHFISCVEHLGWPDDVVVEDLSYSAHLVLHRLQELRPQKLVLVGTARRQLDPPGTIRRYRPRVVGEAAGDVHERLVSAISGTIDIDHTLAVARHWGALPADTVVIEVEPADAGLGPGFSADMSATIDPLLALVREELHFDDLDGNRAVVGSPDVGECWRGSPKGFHSPQLEGVAVTGRAWTWGDGRAGGDWYDVVPLEDGWIGVAIGDVAGRGAEAADVMHELRGATRAYLLRYGEWPAQVLVHLDRLVEATGVGEMTTLLYLALHVPSGRLRLSNAGHCPPLVLSASGTAAFLEEGGSVPLGTVVGIDRPEVHLSLAPESTLLLYTDGLVESRHQPLAEGLAQLRRAVANGPAGPEALCEHVLAVCQNGRPRDDDLALLSLRMG